MPAVRVSFNMHSKSWQKNNERRWGPVGVPVPCLCVGKGGSHHRVLPWEGSLPDLCVGQGSNHHSAQAAARQPQPQKKQKQTRKKKGRGHETTKTKQQAKNIKARMEKCQLIN